MERNSTFSFNRFLFGGIFAALFAIMFAGVVPALAQDYYKVMPPFALENTEFSVDSIAKPTVCDLDDDGTPELVYSGLNTWVFQSLKYYAPYWYQDKILKLSNMPGASYPLFAQCTVIGGDFSGDGYDDLVVISPEGRIHLYKRYLWQYFTDFYYYGTLVGNSGDTLEFGSMTRGCLYDVDGDGREDLIIGIKSGWVFWYKNNGFDDFSFGGFIQTNDGALRVDSVPYPTVTDVNGDGHWDLIIGTGSGNIEIYYNQGNDTFNLARTLSVSNAYVSPTAIDINNDGHDDLVVGMPDGKSVIYLYDTQSNAFEYDDYLTVKGQMYSNWPTGNAQLIDYNGDGNEDIVSVLYFWVWGNLYYPMIYFRNDDGNIVSSYYFYDSDNYALVFDHEVYPTMADVDGDGDMDLIIGNNDGYLYEYQNNNGKFDSVGYIYAHFGNYVFPIYIGDYTAIPRYFDIDNDGDLDLFIGGSGKIYAFENVDGGLYARGVLMQTDGDTVKTSPMNVPAFKDIDEDGDNDLVVGSFMHVWVYLNNGSMEFDSVGYMSVVESSRIFPYTYLSPSFGYVTKSCKKDLFVAAKDGHFYVFQYLDTTPPVLVCHPDTTVVAQGSSGYHVSGTELDPVMYNDNCGIYYMYNGLNYASTLQGYTLPLGRDTIYWYAVDSTYNWKWCRTVVEVTTATELREYVLRFYPNPAHDYLNITGGLGYTVDVLDVQSRQVVAPKQINSQSYRLDISGLPAGVYLLRFSKPGETKTFRLVVR